MIGAAQHVDAARVEAALEEVLARPEFEPEGQGPLARFLAELFERAPGASISSEAATWIAVALAVVALVLLGRALAVTLGDRGRPGAPAGPAGRGRSAPTARERARALRERARAARAEADLGRALRLDFTALVVGLGDAGGLEYRDAWTNRELVERGGADPALAARLEPWVDLLDRVGWGGAQPTEGDVDALDRFVTESLGGAS